MGLPERTRAQRLAALALAREHRIATAKIRQQIRDGEVTLGELIARIDDDPVVQRIKVMTLLSAMVGVSGKRSTIILEQAKISPSRTMGGISHLQRDRPLDVLAKRHPSQVAHSSR